MVVGTMKAQVGRKEAESVTLSQLDFNRFKKTGEYRRVERALENTFHLLSTRDISWVMKEMFEEKQREGDKEGRPVPITEWVEAVFNKLAAEQTERFADKIGVIFKELETAVGGLDRGAAARLAGEEEQSTKAKTQRIQLVNLLIRRFSREVTGDNNSHVSLPSPEAVEKLEDKRIFVTGQHSDLGRVGDKISGQFLVLNSNQLWMLNYLTYAEPHQDFLKYEIYSHATALKPISLRETVRFDRRFMTLIEAARAVFKALEEHQEADPKYGVRYNAEKYPPIQGFDQYSDQKRQATYKEFMHALRALEHAGYIRVQSEYGITYKDGREAQRIRVDWRAKQVEVLEPVEGEEAKGVRVRGRKEGKTTVFDELGITLDWHSRATTMGGECKDVIDFGACVQFGEAMTRELKKDTAHALRLPADKYKPPVIKHV